VSGTQQGGGSDELPLLHAVYQNDNDVLSGLVIAGADPDTTGEEGVTVLMLACFLGHANIVETLLNHNANVDLQDARGRTALMYACYEGNAEIVVKLEQHHADANVRDYAGVTAEEYKTYREDGIVMDGTLIPDSPSDSDGRQSSGAE